MKISDLRLQRAILEVRYDRGSLYWDKSGSTILNIQQKFPEWTWEDTTGERVVLRNTSHQMEMNFGYAKMTFIQHYVDNLDPLKSVSDDLIPIVVSNLQIAKFVRIGNRYLYILPLKSTDEGKKILAESQAIIIPEQCLSIYGKDAAKDRFTYYVHVEDFSYRLELAIVERTRIPGKMPLNEKYDPELGLRVDIDIAKVNDVESFTFKASDFIEKNDTFLRGNLMKLIE